MEDNIFHIIIGIIGFCLGGIFGSYLMRKNIEKSLNDLKKSYDDFVEDVNTQLKEFLE